MTKKDHSGWINVLQDQDEHFLQTKLTLWSVRLNFEQNRSLEHKEEIR